MKSFTRACLIFSGVVIAIGLVLTIIGGALGAENAFAAMVKKGVFSFSWNDDLIYNTDDLKNKNEEFNDIDKLDIDLKYGELYIKVSDDNTYKVDATNVVKDFKCENKDGTLVMKDNIKSGLKLNFGKEKHPVITLYIPENTSLKNAVIDMGAGYVSSSNLSVDELTINVGAGNYEGSKMNAKEADLSVGAGHLSISEFASDSLNMDCGTGRMELSGSVTGNADIECGIGNIVLSLENSETDYNYDVNCGIGNVIIGKQSFGGIACEKTIDNNADNNMNVDCGVGNVSVSFDN